MNSRGSAYLTSALAVAFAIAPALTEPFTGYTADQLAVPQPNPPIQPPGWAFSIWGVIYAWVLLGTGYGAWRAADAENWGPMRPSFALALALGAVWLAIANASPFWASIVIAVMAASAITALLRAGSMDWMWQVAPVAILAGWLTAATGVSFSVMLAGFGVLGSQVAGVLCLLVVLVVALWVVSQRAEWPYGFGVGWALFGVCITAYGQDNWVVLALAALGLATLVGLLVQRKL